MIDGSSKCLSGLMKFGGALNHQTAMDDHQVAHSSSDDDAPLVKRSRFREDVADVQGPAISLFRGMKRAAEPCSLCGVLTVNPRQRDTDNLPVCEQCVRAFRTAETSDDVKDNDNFVTKNTQPSQPSSVAVGDSVTVRHSLLYRYSNSRNSCSC